MAQTLLQSPPIGLPWVGSLQMSKDQLIEISNGKDVMLNRVQITELLQKQQTT